MPKYCVLKVLIWTTKVFHSFNVIFKSLFLVHHKNSLQCIKSQHPRTAVEYNKILNCLCQNRQKCKLNNFVWKHIIAFVENITTNHYTKFLFYTDFKGVSKKMIQRMCPESNSPNIPLWSDGSGQLYKVPQNDLSNIYTQHVHLKSLRWTYFSIITNNGISVIIFTESENTIKVCKLLKHVFLLSLRAYCLLW